MLCKEIIQVIEASYPREAALGFDNVGLLAGRAEKEVNRIYLALDATDAVIDRAIEAGADLLVTHHPLIFNPMKKVTDEDFIGRRILKIIQNDLCYYAMHTNYHQGVATLLEKSDGSSFWRIVRSDEHLAVLPMESVKHRQMTALPQVSMRILKDVGIK